MASEGTKCLSGSIMSQPSSPSFLVTLSIANSLTAITTMALNFVILLTIWKTTSLHKPSFLLLANLALADFLVGAISQPARVVRNFLLLSSSHHNSSSESTKEVCASALVTQASAYWLGAVSLYILTLISIDRVLAIRLKTSYRNVLTTRKIGIALLSFWIVSGILIQTIIFHLERNSSKYLPVVLMPVGSSVFLLIIVVCYSKSIQELRRLISQVSPARSNSQSEPGRASTFDVKKYEKTLKTMLIIFSVMIICYIPYVFAVISLGVSSFLFPGKNYVSYSSIISFCDFVVWSSSTTNPLLYLWRMRELRQAARRTLSATFQRRYPHKYNNTKRMKSGQRKTNIVIVKERVVNLQLNMTSPPDDRCRKT